MDELKNEEQLKKTIELLEIWIELELELGTDEELKIMLNNERNKLRKIKLNKLSWTN